MTAPPGCPAPPRHPQDGTRSPILAWEDGYMLAQGIPSSQDLQKVVEAISYFGIL